jgi:hypothetical protein
LTAVRALRVALAFALCVTFVFYAALVGRDFYHHADRAIWVTTDDGEAAIAYALASHGRYAFLSSPVLAGMSRLGGQFNYGPWYFYTAAAAIWLFGYSLTLVRALHFWVVIGCAAAAFAWFRGRDRLAAPALFGFGFLYFFSVAEWPMARPDSFVTAFAIAMIVFAGLAVTRKHARYWLLAGMAAACGAFTHLIALALVPAVVVIFLISVWAERAESAAIKAETWRSAAALAAGLALGALMFYASFGFDLAGQYRFLRSYRATTASTDTYVDAIAKHFGMAFGSQSPWARAAVVMTLVAAWLLTAFASARTSFRRLVIAYVLPPVTVWTLYLASNGKYTNYHSGYAILHHALFAWTAAAMLWTLLKMSTASSERRALATAGGIAAATVVLVFGVRLTASQVVAAPRAEQAAALVPFSEYENHVLGSIPARAPVWGSVFLGIESPDRVQLVQYEDAISIAHAADAQARPGVAPDYLVLGYPETLDTVLAGLRGSAASAVSSSTLHSALDGAVFRLQSLTAAWPYGTTRVYVRAEGEAVQRVPTVAVYDAAHERWLTRLGAALPLSIARVAPATMYLGYEEAPPASVATTTVQTTLPYGAYMLRVTLSPSTGHSNRRIIAAVTPDGLSQTIRQLAPDGDFAQYAPRDRVVYAALFHKGGPLSINQFDDSMGASIEAVDAYPIDDSLDPASRPSRDQPLTPLAQWDVVPGVRTSMVDGRLHVDGNATPLGYEVSTPVIPFGRGDYVEVRVQSTVTTGRICNGVLNADQTRWLVVADELHEVMQFRGDATAGFRVVFANCGRDAKQPSRFDVSAGSYAIDAPHLYADRLLGAAFGSGGPLSSISRVADLDYVSGIVTVNAGTWTIDGRADAQYSYLLLSKPRRLTTEQRVVVSGRVEKGAMSIGLLQDTRWKTQWRVDAGPFRVVLVPPATGDYSIVVANDLGESLDVSRVIDSIAVYAAGAVPQS